MTWTLLYWTLSLTSPNQTTPFIIPTLETQERCEMTFQVIQNLSLDRYEHLCVEVNNG